jgi:hypothetical protein
VRFDWLLHGRGWPPSPGPSMRHGRFIASFLCHPAEAIAAAAHIAISAIVAQRPSVAAVWMLDLVLIIAPVSGW